MQKSVYNSLAMLFTLTLFTLFGHDLQAQRSSTGTKSDSVPFSRRLTPVISATPVPPATPDSVIEERLVELALEGPQYLVTDHQIKISEYQLSKARKSWLNLLAISANYNDQTFAKTPATPVGGTQYPAYIYPKYFYGVTIPLGVLFSMGPDIKAAKENVAINKDNQAQRAREIRATVLTKYKQYKNYGQLIALQNTIVVDEQTGIALGEKKFKDGTISIEAYNQLNRAYNNDLSQKLNLQLAQDMVKLEIEAMIGVSLETVIN